MTWKIQLEMPVAGDDPDKVKPLTAVRHVMEDGLEVPALPVRLLGGITESMLDSSLTDDMILRADSGTPWLFDDDVEINGAFTVSGVVTLDDNLSVGGALEVTGATTLLNDVLISATLTVNDTFDLNGALSVSGASTFSGAVDFLDTVSFHAPVTFSSTAGFLATVSFQEVNIAGELSAGTLRVAGQSTLVGPVVIDGVTMYGTGGTLQLNPGQNIMTLSGNIEAHTGGFNSVTPGDYAYGIGGVTLVDPSGNIFAGNIDASGNLVIDGTGQFSGVASFLSNVTVSGTLSAVGNILSRGSIYATTIYRGGVGSFSECINENGEYIGDKVKITQIGGLAVLLTNYTGFASVKGTCVKACEEADDAVSFADASGATYADPLGFMYEDGISHGKDTWIVIAGIAEALLKDNTSAGHGNWVGLSDEAGRVTMTLSEPPGGGLVEQQKHMAECGHCIQDVASGEDQLARLLVHFN